MYIYMSIPSGLLLSILLYHVYIYIAPSVKAHKQWLYGYILITNSFQTLYPLVMSK